MIGLRIAEELTVDWTIWFLNDWWLAIAIACLVSGLWLFPYGSWRKPQDELRFIIKWIDFRRICDDNGQVEDKPTIALYIKIENQADIDQKIDYLEGDLSYSASYDDNNFREHPLQNPFTKRNQVIKAKASKLIDMRVAIQPESARRFMGYMDAGEYIFWSGIINVDVSAKIWSFERGGRIERRILPKSPIVPTTRHFEGIEELL